jgi:hypothetical protein
VAGGLVISLGGVVQPTLSAREVTQVAVGDGLLAIVGGHAQQLAQHAASLGPGLFAAQGHQASAQILEGLGGRGLGREDRLDRGGHGERGVGERGMGERWRDDKRGFWPAFWFGGRRQADRRGLAPRLGLGARGQGGDEEHDPRDRRRPARERAVRLEGAEIQMLGPVPQDAQTRDNVP